MNEVYKQIMHAVYIRTSRTLLNRPVSEINVGHDIGRFELLDGREESVEGAGGGGAGASPVAGELLEAVAAPKNNFKQNKNEKAPILWVFDN